jgi:hypothetical protein
LKLKPPLFYLPAHPEAKLTTIETQELISGLEKTFGKDTEGKSNENGENKEGK